MDGHARALLTTAHAVLNLSGYRDPTTALTFAEIAARVLGPSRRERERVDAAPSAVPRDIRAPVRTLEAALADCVARMSARTRILGGELLRLRIAIDRLEGALRERPARSRGAAV